MNRRRTLDETQARLGLAVGVFVLLSTLFTVTSPAMPSSAQPTSVASNAVIAHSNTLTLPPKGNSTSSRTGPEVLIHHGLSHGSYASVEAGGPIAETVVFHMVPTISAIASANVTSGAAPLSVQFYASASGGSPPYSYLWDFGNRASSSLQNSTYKFSSQGVYVVTLTVYNSQRDTATASLTIVAQGGTQYTVFFTEYGLPLNTEWSATLGGQTRLTTTSIIPINSSVAGLMPWSIQTPINIAQGVRYASSNASGSIDIPKVVVVSVRFSEQFLLALSSFPTSGGTISPTPNINWYPAGQVLTISAHPASSFSFDRWLGVGQGSYSGPTNSVQITLAAPINETAIFISPSITATPSSGSPGVVVSVTGGGFAPATAYTICLRDPQNNCIQSVDFSSDSQGRVPSGVTLTIPLNASAGIYTITVSYGGSPFYSITFDVSSSVISLNPSAGPVGSTVVVTGYNLAANSVYTLCFGPGHDTCTTALIVFTSTSDGSVPAGVTFNVPSVSQFGTFYVCAQLGSSIVAWAAFEVQAQYKVTFVETGLPPGTPWKVILGIGPHFSANLTFASTGTTLPITVVAGNYAWTVMSPISGQTGTRFLASSSAGAVLVENDTVVKITFITQYHFAGTASPPSGGQVSPAEGWYTAGQSITISAQASPGYGFVSWQGSGPGSYSGPNVTARVVMNGPVVETASFSTAFVFSFSFTGLGPDAAGPVLNVDGVNYTASQPTTFPWASGSTHTFSCANDINAGQGKRYAWVSTSGASAQPDGVVKAEPDMPSLVCSYKVQYYLAVIPNVGVVNATGTGWYDAETSVEVTPRLQNLNSTLGYLLYGAAIDGKFVIGQAKFNMDGPHQVAPIYWLQRTVQVQSGSQSFRVSIATNSTAVSVAYSPQRYELSFELNSNGGKVGGAILTVPLVMIDAQESNTSSVVVFVDGKPVHYTSESEGESLLLSVGYPNGTKVIQVFLKSYVVRVEVASLILGQGLQGSSVAVKSNDGSIAFSNVTDGSGTLAQRLPPLSYQVETASIVGPSISSVTPTSNVNVSVRSFTGTDSAISATSIAAPTAFLLLVRRRRPRYTVGQLVWYQGGLMRVKSWARDGRLGKVYSVEPLA